MEALLIGAGAGVVSALALLSRLWVQRRKYRP